MCGCIVSSEKYCSFIITAIFSVLSKCLDTGGVSIIMLPNVKSSLSITQISRSKIFSSSVKFRSSE